MGLITGLLTLPMAPVRGVVWITEQLYEQAQRETEGPAAVRRQLLELEAARAAGTVTEEEAAEQEALLVRRLWAARGTDGGRRV